MRARIAFNWGAKFLLIDYANDVCYMRINYALFACCLQTGWFPVHANPYYCSCSCDRGIPSQQQLKADS